MKHATLALGVFMLLSSSNTFANEYGYDAVKKRYPKSALAASQVENAKMQGECLVGLKDLNFKKKDKFDPVAEWGNYRSLSLLEQFPPCEVLIMMEVAQSNLKARNKAKQ